jgi:purine-binding chemotaxis protein CheW
MEDQLFSPFAETDRFRGTEAPLPAVPPVCRELPLRRGRGGNPLEIILAGREAAGCDDDLPLASDEQAEAADSYEEILCFRVADETYGINIMEIKEIIKPRETTEVPRAPSFVTGVLSLRGVVIPVLDMHDRLGLPRRPRSGRERIVIVKQSEGFTGLLVDEVVQVVRIGKEGFEPAPAVLEESGRDFVSGIGHSGTMMIILLDVAHIVAIDLP